MLARGLGVCSAASISGVGNNDRTEEQAREDQRAPSMPRRSSATAARVSAESATG